jgi:hypothetical protein
MKIKEVHSAKIVYKDNNTTTIEWIADTGFGHLSIEYNKNGRYTIDAEYLSIDTVIKIIKAIPNKA